MKQFYRMIHNDHPRAFLYTFIAGVSQAILPFITLYLSSVILDQLLIGNYETAKQMIVILLSLSFIVGVVWRSSSQALIVIKDAAYYSVWKQTANKAYILEYEEFEKTSTMDKIRRAQNGSNGSGGISAQIEDTKELISMSFSLFFSFIFVISLFLQSSFDGVFAIITILFILAFIIFIWYGMKINKKLAILEIERNHKNEHVNSTMGYFMDACIDVKNGKDIRLYKMQKMLLIMYRHFCNYANQCFKGYVDIASKDIAWISFFSQLLAGLVYIYVGIAVLQGYISIGKVLLYTGAITSVTSTFNQFISIYDSVAYRFEYLGNFESFINSPNMHYDGTLPIEKRDDHEYEFEFKNVSFKYPDTEAYVLKNINLKLKVHQRLALVGQNGAGKTTLIKLLCRLYEPSAGEILLNGINIAKYDYAEYTQIFSIVFQDFKIFPLYLDENIAGSSVVDQDKCKAVLKQVGLMDKVNNWPNKIHSRLYKNLGDGINVSGGEAQKIAIARALYKDAPFVIMDEPTASLDPLAEAEIYDSFNQMIKDKSAIFISHRMSSCRFCDEIVVLDNGQIIQQGKHELLVKQEGLYKKLWNAQADYYA